MEQAHSAFDSQHRVIKNLDPALDPAHEHSHGHLHHSANAEKGRHDDPVYSIGTTGEKSAIPDADPNDHALHRRGHPERHNLSSVDKNLSDKDLKESTIAYDNKYDAEDASAGNTGILAGEESEKRKGFGRIYRRYRVFFHLAIFMLFTG
jgi:CNT family concentrative nucleoside transporter